MGAIASQITSLTIVYSIVYSYQTQIKENIKAPRHWPLCEEFTWDRWIPRTNGQLRGKCFHLMTSSCQEIFSWVTQWGGKIFDESLHHLFTLTHWGRVTQMCVGKPIIIGSGNGLSPVRRQAIIWTNAGILLIRPLGIKFSEILIDIRIFSFKKMCLKLSSAKWRPFCLGLDVSMCQLQLCTSIYYFSTFLCRQHFACFNLSWNNFSVFAIYMSYKLNMITSPHLHHIIIHTSPAKMCIQILLQFSVCYLDILQNIHGLNPLRAV